MDEEFSARTERLIFAVNKLTVNSRNRLILDVADYILTNVENGDLSLKSVALEFYTNKTYLSHIFKIEAGISFVNYVTVVKMERAKVLFKNDLKVYELAERLGYNDPEYFGKLFKNTPASVQTATRKSLSRKDRLRERAGLLAGTGGWRHEANRNPSV